MKKALVTFLILFGFAGSLLVFTGCIAAPIRQSLANQGPLAVDPKNPYVATNILLEKEAEQSATVKGFLKLTGRPDVIEVKKKMLEPYKIYLFYLGENVAYRWDEGREDWIIKGPEEIPSEVRESLRRLEMHPRKIASAKETILENKDDLKKAKPLVAEEKEKKPKSQLEELIVAEQAHSRINRNIPIKPLRKEEPPSSGEKELQIVEEPIDSTQSVPPLDTKQGPTVASETPSGDIVHRVSVPGETLRIIATWYTGDFQNAGRLARINSLKNPNQLSLGQAIRIPRYLLVRTAPLPMDEVESRLQKKAE